MLLSSRAIPVRSLTDFHTSRLASKAAMASWLSPCCCSRTPSACCASALRRGSSASAVTDRPFDAGVSFTRATVRVPKPSERGHQANGEQPAIGIIGGGAPIECFAEVVLLGGEAIGPRQRFGPPEVGPGLLGQGDEVLAMSTTDVVEVAAIGKCRECGLPHHAEHGDARFTGGAFTDRDQADVGERLDHLQRPAGRRCARKHCGDGGEIGATGEHAEMLEAVSIVGGEKVDAPGDGRFEGALASGPVVLTRGERDALSDTPRQGDRAQHAQLRGRELDGEREPFESCADCRNGRCVVARQRE